MIERAEAEEKVAAGWLRAWLAFEALAVSPEVARTALDSLLAKLEADPRVKLYSRQLSQPERVERPPIKGIELAHSCVAETELVAKDFAGLVGIVIEFGPSAVEILEPKSLALPMGAAQEILNAIAAMMHRFAAAGVGGLLLVHGKG